MENIELPSGVSSTHSKHKTTYIILGVVLVLLAVILFVYNTIVYRTEISEFNLKAEISDTAGVAPESRFILTSSAALTPQVIEKYLKVTPEIEVEVKKLPSSGNSYEIVPKNELDVNKVYTIAIDKGPLAAHDYSWAFQTKAPFQIVSSIPADKGASAPLNTGIEITFNREGVIDPEKYIEITPQVSGRFEVSGALVRFIPNNPLLERTVYTVKVKSGMKAQNTNDVFENDQTIAFETDLTYSAVAKPYIYFSRISSEFRPGDAIAFDVNEHNSSKVDATLYRMDSSSEYLSSLQKAKQDRPWTRYYKNIDSITPEGKKVSTYSLSVEKQLEYAKVVRLPESLKEGYYALLIDNGQNKDIVWFQVNPAVSFTAYSNVQSLVWLKDSKTGNGMADISITLNGKEIGKTKNDGVAVFSTPTELIQKIDEYTPYYQLPTKYVVAKIPSGDLVIPVESEYGYGVSVTPEDKWWKYISLNKNIYLPSDTLKFWGVIKSRNGEAIKEELKVTLSDSYWSYNKENVTMYAETKVTPSEYNAVTGEVSFANLKPGLYVLTFKKGDEMVAQQTVTISAYVKPAYKVSITPSKGAVFAGEAVTFKVKAEFFDGTPVSNSSLQYTAYGSSVDAKAVPIKLNTNGEASFTLTPVYRTDYGYWPNYMSVNLGPAQAEEASIEASSYVYVFGPRVFNTITGKRSGETTTYDIKTLRIVLKDGERGVPYWDSNEYLGNVVPGASTKVEVVEVNYTKTQTGTGYDAINKQTYPIYDYNTLKNLKSTQTITANSNGVAQFSFTPEKEKRYEITFFTDDGSNRTTKDMVYVYGTITAEGGSDSYYQSESNYYLSNLEKDSIYKVGEPILLKLQNYRGESPSDAPQSFLFVTLRNGLIEYKIQNSSFYTNIFQEKDIPNVTMWSGWYNGKKFTNTYATNLSFDANERRLKLTINKDKQTYKPGEEVKLEIKVTDKNNSPVRAEVNISALDEAVFSIRPDERDIVSELYQDIYSPFSVRTSNQTPGRGGGGAEKGGGDGDTPRSNLKELAIYQTLTTDASGVVKTSFKLPDNITSWRLNTQAVTKELFAAKDISFIPVSLPFFVDATLNKTYLAGDSLVLRLRSFGTNIPSSGITYTAEASTLPFKKVEASGGGSVELMLGELLAGNHALTVRAKTASASDALTRELKVVPSYFTKNVSDFYEGTSGLKVKNQSLGYTTVTFSSLGKGRLYRDLKELSWNGGIRLDQKGTEFVAKTLLNQYFGEKNDTSLFDISKYQISGLKLLPYSSEELELSAIAADVFPRNVLDESPLKFYFTTSLNDKKTDTHRVVRALYGLAALGEPVLTKVQSLKNNKELTIEDKVFVALALDVMGAKEEARAYYRASIKSSIETKGDYAYVSTKTNDLTITTTALTAALAASLEESDAVKLALYADQNYPKETLSNFERLLYIKKALPQLDSEEVSFKYKTGSKEESKTLKNGEVYSVTLSAQDLESLQLSAIKGKVGVALSYEKSSTASEVKKDSNLSLLRDYSVEGGVKKEFKEGEIVKVTLKPTFTANALSGSYQLVDYAPSGLRPIEETFRPYYYYDTYRSEGREYPVEFNDQKVTFVIEKDSKRPIYYYARVVSKGSYKADATLFQSLRSLESATVSNEDRITIK